MQIANGVNMLTLSSTMMGRIETVYPTLLWDNDTAVLIDTGYPGQLPLIKEAIEKAGVPFDRLNKLLITHQDLDHIGGLPAILAQLPHKSEVLANQLEKPYIQGEIQLLKITPASIEAAINAMPPEVPAEWRTAFRKVLEHPPAAAVDTTLKGGMELPYCGGIIVIDTPGHTPGHISLYHKASKTLIAADALMVENGVLLGPEPQYCVDPQLALQSLKKLALFEIEAVICYHGGLYKGNVNKRILELTDV